MYFDNLIKDFRKIGVRERSLILGLLLFCFLLGFISSVVIGKSVFYLNISTQISNIPSPTPAPATLYIKLSSTNVTVDQNFEATINLSSPATGVEAADFVINYDPTLVKPTDIKTGNFFKSYPLKKIGDNFIKISATASFVNNKITIPKGSGTVATINFVALKAQDQKSGKNPIYFDSEKTIVAADGKNIIGKLGEDTLTIK